MPKIFFKVAGLLIILIPFFTYLSGEIKAQTVSCSASSYTHNMSASSTVPIDFSLRNDGSASIIWIKFAVPNGNFTLNSASAEGWSVSSDGTFTGGTLGVDSNLNPSVSVSAGPNNSSGDWTIQVSSNPDGSDSVNCGGTLDLSITGGIGQEGPPNISDIVVSEITDSSAKITWTTESLSNSLVDYGISDSYGSSAGSSGDSTTSHSVSLGGLSASATYHYNVKSTNAYGTSESGDNVFTSADPGQTAASTTGTAATGATSSKDTTKPSITLLTSFSKTYINSPLISGGASDNSGISLVEYSTDGGASWTSASVKNKGSKNVTFSFSLGVLDDGNYDLMVRAKDSSGNTSDIKQYTLIIDRLPPQIGATMISLGPQFLTPTKEGVLITAPGLEQKITLSAVGGPISLEINGGDEKLNLEKNVDSGLWAGTLKFGKSGSYELVIKSIDGAKNETIQNLAKVFVQEAGKVLYLGKPVKAAKISVYVFEPTLGQFVLWDGAPYSEANPQETDENGNYSLFLPTGKYYLEARFFGVMKYRTQIFDLMAPSLVNADLSSGPLTVPFVANQIIISPTKSLPKEALAQNPLIEKDFPVSLLKEETGADFPLGKPYLVSVLGTWLPDASAQIQILEGLNQNDFKKVVLVPQESKSNVEIFKKRGQYSLEFLVDPDGKLVEPLFLRFLPTHFFLDKDGKIKKIVFGTLSQEEILENLK